MDGIELLNLLITSGSGDNDRQGRVGFVDYFADLCEVVSEVQGLHELKLIHDYRESIILNVRNGIVLQKLKNETRGSNKYLGLRLFLIIVHLFLEVGQGLVEVTKS